MPWAGNPGQSSSPRRGEGSVAAKLTKSSEPIGKEEIGDEKETTFIEEESASQLRARPLSPLVVHSRGEEDEGGEEDSLDYSTEETPVVRIHFCCKYKCSA